jgi:hypothetical protein
LVSGEISHAVKIPKNSGRLAHRGIKKRMEAVREFPPEARLDFGPRGIKITETEPLGDFPREEGRKKFGYLH